jgi:hypothetical protein
MARKFHLGWFLQGSSVQAWGELWTGNIGTEWMVPDFFIEMTKNLERACFDYVLLEDSSYIGESYGGSREIYLHHGLSTPRQDPSIVAALLARETKRIGIVTTLGTFASRPISSPGRSRRSTRYPPVASAGTRSLVPRTSPRAISAWTACPRMTSATTSPMNTWKS